MHGWKSTHRWTLFSISVWTLVCLVTYLLQATWRYSDWRREELHRFDRNVIAAARMLYSSGLPGASDRRPFWKAVEEEFQLQFIPIEVSTLPADWSPSRSFGLQFEMKPHVWSVVPGGGWSLVTEVQCLDAEKSFGSYRVSRFLKWDRYETLRLSFPAIFLWLIGTVSLSLAILVPAKQWQEWTDRIRAWTQLTTSTSVPGALGGLSTDDLSEASRPALELLKDSLQRLDRQWMVAASLQQQNTEILQGMLVGVVTMDSQLRVHFANRAACQLLELPAIAMEKNSLENRSIWELVRQPKITGLLQGVLQQEEAESLPFAEDEVETPAKNMLRVRASRWKTSSGIGVIMTITDETRLHRLENMRREFTTNVSHELKTPLAAIKAYTETLLLGALEDSLHSRRFVERIAEQSTRLENLIYDLLKLARIQDASAWVVDRVHLASAIRQSYEAYRALAESKSVSLRMNEVDEQLYIHGDRDAITTIVNNLLGNAVRYTPMQGSVTLQVEVQGDVLSLEVADTGIGIAPEYHERIFERFFRVDQARSSDDGGTGLGLSIVKNIANSLGGRVHLTSQMGKGSTFRVELPSKVEHVLPILDHRGT